MKKIQEVTFKKVKDQFGWLSNMSDHSVKYEEEWYQNTETLFHCLRFKDYPEIVEELRDLSSPMIVKMKAKKYRRILKINDGFKINKQDDLERMRLCIRLKVERHKDLKRLLVVTQDATIIEDCSRRRGGSGKYWGASYEDGVWVGENVLGRLWMELREELKLEFKLPEKTPFFVAWDDSLKPKIGFPKRFKLTKAA